MSWNLAVDHALEYWQDVLPDISNICIKETEKPESLLNKSLNSDDLFPEPRSLDSSELSDSSSDQTTNIWTTEEDSTLVESVERNKFEWEEIAKSFPNTSVKNIERRWKKLNEHKTKTEFNEEQDKLILSLYKTYGANWKKISAFFDGVSPSMIKKRYYEVLRPKIGKEPEVKEDQEATGKSIIEKVQSPQGAEDLPESEKRTKLLSLYQKMIDIENYIKKTKSQIQDLVTKSK